MEHKDYNRGLSIKANKIEIGEDVSFGKNVIINVKDTFRIGDRSSLGDGTRIEGRSVSIGDDHYNSGGLSIGLNRRDYEDAVCIVGHRSTTHNNKIDLSRSVHVGSDVGLSPDVTIYTHGYWLSVLDGYPAKFLPVSMGNGVIVGYRSLVLPGATIGDKAVIGGQSVVSGRLEGGWIYVGSPARKLRPIKPLSEEEKRRETKRIVDDYKRHASYRGIAVEVVEDYPTIIVNNCSFDVEKLMCVGREDETTDDFRDFVFRRGLRYYTKRRFKALNVRD